MKNSVIACAASGPSLTLADCQLLYEAEIPIIAVNDSWRVAPFCSAIYAADFAWWREHASKIPVTAARWCGSRYTAIHFGISYLQTAIPGSFNSGQRAIELAATLGASRILLLGYDCSLKRGIHWHGAHAAGRLRNPTHESVIAWQGEFSRLAAACSGVEIVNCSRDTSLKCFQRERLETAIERLSSHPVPVRRSSVHRTG
ncbi:hypothetical protein [Citrobacter rodentium]|uniref:Norphogenetic protein n=2 Tax=Citrobacter rodentium TaxID=67825 RepID=A0A482PMF6_CITRO|nr:hypothetical protein [Citrobacter rodentium]QBY29092.1 hypothetical protein E2R62_09610 [Citrobacter rodentium]UHO29051.1 hypothetical protein K7R23_13315 [Citrobacter rodentium NBRC 105723 = DSM 16636]CBG89349.1 hypothetical prophage protein [Citrobacter rodentium ICC168]HAT8013915.1 hypothetical protein [Citrobacter rodentium NBRC 105723 = DSM 16636]HAT8018945.1 hypothetical protein [Citrobacter rodentium]